MSASAKFCCFRRDCLFLMSVWISFGMVILEGLMVFILIARTVSNLFNSSSFGLVAKSGSSSALWKTCRACEVLRSSLIAFVNFNW